MAINNNLDSKLEELEFLAEDSNYPLETDDRYDKLCKAVLYSDVVDVDAFEWLNIYDELKVDIENF